jgi:DNA polymerase-4
MSERKIIHVDMDAFYASIEERENPQLKGKPVIVGGTVEGRGVVSAANYAARKFGLHSAMPMVRAVRLCPQVIRLASNMQLYAEVSRQIREIFFRYTPVVQPLALDEAFLDVTSSEKLFGAAEEVGMQIKQAIKNELKLVASVGVAPSKFVAKIASDVNKPNGFVVVAQNKVQSFLDPLPVSRLWGAGKATVAVFDRMGIRTIAQLRHQPVDWLVSRFGKFGEHLWQLANGIDEREVVVDSQAKSISNETTFSQDIANREVLEATLLHLTEQVAWRLRKAGLKGRTVQLKLRYPDFRLITRAHTMVESTDNTNILWSVVRDLLRHNWQGRPAIRLVGMGVSGLQSEDDQPQQADLFAEQNARLSALDRISDNINARFGPSTLHRGRTTKSTTE